VTIFYTDCTELCHLLNCLEVDPSENTARNNTCCDCWLPWKSCLSGCCLDTDLRKRCLVIEVLNIWEVSTGGSHNRFHIQNYHFYRIDRHPERKGGIAIAVRKGNPCMNVDLPPLVSVEAIGVCIHIGNQEVLIAAVYKSPGRTMRCTGDLYTAAIRTSWLPIYMQRYINLQGAP
jgi:hypothetical protein